MTRRRSSTAVLGAYSLADRSMNTNASSAIPRWQNMMGFSSCRPLRKATAEGKSVEVARIEERMREDS